MQANERRKIWKREVGSGRLSVLAKKQRDLVLEKKNLSPKLVILASMEQPEDTSTDIAPPSISSEEEKAFRNWLELPSEVTATILHKVGAFDILNHAQMVCTSWLHICKDPSMWRSIDTHDSNAYGDYWFDTEGMARHAVDRSCGQLLDINIEYFGTDEFIHYLAQQ